MRIHGLNQRYKQLRNALISPDLEDKLYRLVIVPLVAFLPARLAYRVACLRGDWRYQLDTLTRERIMCNLERALGDQLTQAERASVAHDFFRRKACEAMDVMRLARSGRPLARLVEIRGLEYIKDALAAGKGAIICSLHFGSFNSCFSLLGVSGFPVTTVGDWRSSSIASMTWIQRFLWRLIQEKPLTRHRHRPNIEPDNERLGAGMRMAEVLRSNELITIAIDGPVTTENRARAVPVDFLDRQILLLPGAVSITQLTGSPLLVLVVRRLKDWRHQVVEISPPLALTGDTVRDFSLCMKMLEAPIRENPAYWDWWVNTQSLIDFGLLPTEELHEKIRG